jgi:hypothetical protein
LFSLRLDLDSVAVGAPLLLARSRTNLVPEKIPLLPGSIKLPKNMKYQTKLAQL